MNQFESIKKSILIIAYCFVATAIYAQSTSAKDTLYDRYQGVIKISPLSFINEISLTYEHPINGINRKYSIETTIGYIIDWKRSKRELYNGPIRSFLDEGIVIRTGFKIYPQGGTHFYFLPRIMYRYVYYNKKTVSIDDFLFGICSDCEIQVRSARSHIIALQYLLGYQVYGKRLMVDFYSGIGIKTKLGKNIIYQSYLGDCYECGEEELCSSCPYSENVFKELDFPIIPSIHLGLRLGYAFNINEKHNE